MENLFVGLEKKRILVLVTEFLGKELMKFFKEKFLFMMM